MNNLQGGQVPASATPPVAQGVVADPSAGQVVPQSSPNVSADTSASSSGVPQGTEGQSQSATFSEEQQRYIQSQLDKQAARYQGEIYRMQQEFNQPKPVQTPTNDTNPHVPNSAEWWLWHQERFAEKAAEKAIQGVMQNAQRMSQQQSEYQWIQTHPGADLNSVKWFLRSKGMPENLLDEGYALMNLPQMAQNVAQTASQAVVNSFKNPTQGTIPVRGGQSAGAGAVELKFEDDVKEFQRTNGRPNWTPERMQLFMEELTLRREQPR